MTTKTRTQTTKPAALWITREGRITCVKHGGMADWQAVTPAHVEQWAAQMGTAAAEVARCETCRMQAPAREDQPMTTEPAPVIVYTRPACVQCTSTTRALERRGIRYAARPMTEDDAARFKAQGHMQAPVVVTEAETWAGYRPDKIIAIPTP